jgi:hypothetical protein
MNNSERMELLQKIESGEVSVEDAIGIMSPAEQLAPVAEPGKSNRWLRVRVTDLQTGKRKVSVRVPIKLMKWGMKLGSRFTSELDEYNIDELLADMEASGESHLVEVEDSDDNQRVEIFFE